MPDILDIPVSPPTGGEVPSLESLLGSSEEGAFTKALGYLERPGRAISEFAGAAGAGEDPLAAALGGLAGEYEYPTLGEQLVPDSPDDHYQDQMFKPIVRTAIDWTTDPLMYMGLGPARKVIGVGSKAASKVLSKIPTPQILARFALPMTHVFEKFGGKAGFRISKGLGRAYQNSKVSAGRTEQDFLQLLTDLGLHGNAGTPYRNAVMDLLRGAPATTAIHADAKTQTLYKWMRSNLDSVADRIGAYKDPTGKKFQTIEPLLADAREKVYKQMRKWKGALSTSGKGWRDDIWKAFAEGGPLPDDSVRTKKVFDLLQRELGQFSFEPGHLSVWKKGFHKRPWQRLQDYAPFILNDKAVEGLFKGTVPVGYHKAVRQFARQLGVQEEKALDILKNMALPKRHGNVEFARHLPFSEELFETDPLIWFPKYIGRLEERIAYADEFGLDGQILNKLFRVIRGDKNSTLDMKWGRDARDIILGKHQTDRSIAGLAQKIMGFQVMTKMGYLSSLSNLSQNANTIIREGGINFLKAILRSMGTEGRRQGYIAYQKGIQEQLIRLAGGQQRLATKYLNVTLFNPIERLNRMLASNAGVLRAEQLLRHELRPGGIGKVTKELSKRGVTEADMLAFAKTGKLPTEAAERVGLLASEATQHATHWKDLPIGWQDPFMRIMTQYKNFVYQQTRFLARDVLKPAKLYFESNGKKGSIAPLTRAFVTFGISAEVVARARDNIKGFAADLPTWWGAAPIDYERREREDAWGLQLLQDCLHVGALGIAGDLVDRASWKDLSSWVLGPTFGDILGFGEEAVAAAGTLHKERTFQALPYERYAAQIVRRVPGAPGVVPGGKPMQQALSGPINDIMQFVP